MTSALDSRLFTLQDQHLFADASGDWNPIHVDPIYARRCLTGQAVVHGAHLAIWALDALARQRSTGGSISQLNVRFHNPVFLDQLVKCCLKSNVTDEYLLDVYCGRTLSMSIKVDVLPGTSLQWTPEKIGRFVSKRPPVVRSVGELAKLAGSWRIDPNISALAAAYPHLYKFLGPVAPALLAHCSRMVGMECPGLHSLFSEMEFKFEDGRIEDSDCFSYRVASLDKRFGLVRAQVECLGFSGTVTAFIRPPPCQQASYVKVASGMDQNVFKGQRALVVGGSRGLGELVTKLLAAGGADVCLTYHRGQQDAMSLVGEIRAHGGVAEAAALDVTIPFSPDWRVPQGWKPTHLYYLATPFIFAGRREEFSQELLLQLMRYYVSGFAEIVAALVEGGLQGIFYPSTVALNELPTDMVEYCAAKSAGETLCHVLQKRYSNVRFLLERLPRLATDQTANLMPVKNADPLPIMQDIVLRMSTPQSH